MVNNGRLIPLKRKNRFNRKGAALRGMEPAMGCWVCGRTSEEVRASQIDDTKGEEEFSNLLAQVTQYRCILMKSASDWWRAVPRDFRQMDFNFIVGNPDQFRGFSALADVNGARGELMGWLASASAAIRGDDEPKLQELKLSSLRGEDRAAILRSMEQFEGNWHRSLAKDGADAKEKRPAGFDGLALEDGIEYLIAAGNFFYDIQGMLVQFAREETRRKQPRLEVNAIPLNGFGSVPVCDVCRGIIVGLRNAAEVAVERPLAEMIRPAEEPAEEPRPVAPLVAQPAPRRVRAQEAAEDASQQASPGYMDIVKKLGTPVQGEEAPRPRYLHEHRLKEDWDEAVAQQPAGA